MTETADYSDPGEVPVLDWLDTALISVDPLYQRPLDSVRIEAILKAFTWRSFGALVVVPQKDGGYHVTDGQHRLEAAKLHPKVKHVPAVIVLAEDIQSEAQVFVDINKNRKNVSPLELFFAQLAADDVGALAVLNVAKNAGVRIPKYPGDYKPKDTIAIASVQGLVARHGDRRAADMLKALADAEFAPITAAQIKAVEHLLTDPEYAGQITLPDLAVAIAAVGTTGDMEAKRFAATHCTPFWKGLASVWFQKCKKRKAPAKQAVGFASVVESARPRTIVPHAPVATQRVVTSSVMGDPAPGRSALDQRRSA